MANALRERNREQLEREIRSAGYQGLLRRLQEGEPFLRRFAGWCEVLAFMREGTSRDPRKDEVLRPIFRAHRTDGDPRWRTILLAVFWPGLASICRQKRKWDPDPEELWQNVFWTFLRVVCRIDVERRSNGLVQKIFNDVVHDLHVEYRRTWDRTAQELPWDDSLPDVAIGHGVDFDAFDREKLRVAEFRELRGYRRSGGISEMEFLLLVARRIYGESPADYARRAGVGYQAAKKRAQRAEAALRRCRVTSG